MRVLSAFVLVTILSFGSASADTGDIEAGQDLFSKCKACHQIGEGAQNKVGPHLNALFGRAAAGLEDFRYSDSFERAGANGLEWHFDTLDVFLENPKAMISGSRMSYRGLKDAKDRRDLIAYLREFTEDPTRMNEADRAAEATDHDLDPAILALVGDVEYGAYLSGECTTCHQANGGDSGIPSIVLWPEADFVVAMHAYKNQMRPHPVMQMVASRLGAEEIAALAAYFATIEQ